MKRLLITLCAAAMLAGTGSATGNDLLPEPEYLAPIAPETGETAFDFKLSGYVFGLKMIKARYKGEYDAGTYRVFSDLKTSGLGALLKKLRIWAVTDGRYDSTGMYPITHTQQNLDKKSRRVQMDYDYGANAVSVDINPPLGSQGVPPASPEERFTADDVMSAILNMMMRGHTVEGEFCNGSVRVFDSKQHYNLRMEKSGTKSVKYDGEKFETTRCLVYYEPINGFDPEDLPNTEEGGTPVKVYFINDKERGLYIPLRFTYKISGFKAVIKLKDMEIEKG